MSYGIRETPSAYEIEIDAGSRDALFREALTAAASLAFPGEHAGFEASVPLQAAGATDQELLSNVVRALLRSAAEGRGALGPPRWLLFEPGRIAATVPLAPGPAVLRRLTLQGAQVEPGSARAALVLENAPPA